MKDTAANPAKPKLSEVCQLGWARHELRLTPLQMRRLQMAALSHGLEPREYILQALRKALESDFGPEVNRCWP